MIEQTNQSPAVEIVFVDVADGAEVKPVEQKESYINQVEADALIDHYIDHIRGHPDFIAKVAAARAAGLPEPTLCITSPYRTQAHLLRQIFAKKCPE